MTYSSDLVEVELDSDLADYIRGIGRIIARRVCGDRLDADEVVNQVIVKLLAKPPMWDPSKGASVKTFLYRCVHCEIIKIAERENRYRNRHAQAADESGISDSKAVGKARGAGSLHSGRRPFEISLRGLSKEDILFFIDSEESRRLCLLYLECKGNVSEVARREGVVEGTIRSRLRMLAPKLRANGFNPYRNEQEAWLERNRR